MYDQFSPARETILPGRNNKYTLFLRQLPGEFFDFAGDLVNVGHLDRRRVHFFGGFNVYVLGGHGNNVPEFDDAAGDDDLHAAQFTDLRQVFIADHAALAERMLLHQLVQRQAFIHFKRAGFVERRDHPFGNDLAGILYIKTAPLAESHNRGFKDVLAHFLSRIFRIVTFFYFLCNEKMTRVKFLNF